MDPELIKKKREYEERKARTKLALKQCTICGAENAKLCQGCGTTAYCSTACQRVDWRDRGHREACKKIRNERAAEAARAEAPTPPPSPPKEIFYGPAPRSHADEVRARIAAEHEAARLRREANPEREPLSERYGSRCPICLEEWDVNSRADAFLTCCCRPICATCAPKVIGKPCPLCRTPFPKTAAESLAHLRRHVENDLPEAITHLGDIYHSGDQLGLTRNLKKAVRLYKRAVELGDVEAMHNLGTLYWKDAGRDGVKLDEKKAMQCFRMAAARGHVHSQSQLSVMLTLQAGIAEQAGRLEDATRARAEAFTLIKICAARGLVNAEFNCGSFYEQGFGVVDVDLEEAKRWYARSAAHGDKDAAFAVRRLVSQDARDRRDADPEGGCAICCEDWDPNEGKRLRTCCCRLVCESCDAGIQRGPCPLCNGEYPTSNKDQLAGILRHAAGGYHAVDGERRCPDARPEALVQLGRGYGAGALGLTKNPERAVKYFQQAVDLGSVRGIWHLADVHIRGLGVEKNRPKAMQLFRMAADKGSVEAESSLAIYLRQDFTAARSAAWEMDDDVACDAALDAADAIGSEALEMARRAAAKGHAKSSLFLAIMYKVGGVCGVDKDLDESKRWYERAAALGDEHAIGRLAEINTSGWGEDLDEA